MNSLINQPSVEVSKSTAKKNMGYLFYWSMGLVVTALYRLGIFALKRGGTVEFQLGPLKYKVSGSKEEAVRVMEQTQIIDV